MPTLKLSSPKLPGVVLEFECRQAIPPWRLAELAAAQASNDVMRQLGGYYEFVMAVLEPDQRGRFATAMHDADDDPTIVERLNEAIGDLMLEYADRPTERASSLPTGGTKTPVTRRVVSLSRGTVEEEQTSQTDGASAAS